jgi:hypothetical protein
MTSEVSPETAPFPSHVDMPQDVLYEILEDEVVLLNLTTEAYYILDDIGTHMWQLLIEHHDPEIVVQQMVNQYEIDEATVRSDLSTLVGQLIERQLLVTREPAS